MQLPAMHGFNCSAYSTKQKYTAGSCVLHVCDVAAVAAAAGSHLGDTVAVTQQHTNLAGGHALLGQLADVLSDLQGKMRACYECKFTEPEQTKVPDQAAAVIQYCCSCAALPGAARCSYGKSTTPYHHDQRQTTTKRLLLPKTRTAAIASH
jgi:hypothetical protein